MELPTMRLFVSQLMNGKSDEEILKERDELVQFVKDKYKGTAEIELVDSFCNDYDEPNDPKILHAPLYYLSKALAKMAECDLIVMGPNWTSGRGTKIEYQCALQYGLAVVWTGPVQESKDEDTENRIEPDEENIKFFY